MYNSEMVNRKRKRVILVLPVVNENFSKKLKIIDIEFDAIQTNRLHQKRMMKMMMIMIMTMLLMILMKMMMINRADEQMTNYNCSIEEETSEKMINLFGCILVSAGGCLLDQRC